MNYRLAKIEDVEAIDSLCKRENIATPSGGMTFIAEDDGKIVGFINVEPRHFINAFVSDNSLASYVLYEKMITALEIAEAKRILIIPKDKNVEELYMKKGFVTTNICVNTMEKIL